MFLERCVRLQVMTIEILYIDPKTGLPKYDKGQIKAAYYTFIYVLHDNILLSSQFIYEVKPIAQSTGCECGPNCGFSLLREVLNKCGGQR